MSGLFKTIVDYKLVNEWAEMLDWLFDENKFDKAKGWTSGYVGSLTKKIRKLSKFSKGNNYRYGSAMSLSFSNIDLKKSESNIEVAFSKNESEAKDLIKHIRNGIAHGRTNCFNYKGELFIEVKDFSDKSLKKQTAYICFPISYIGKIYKLYLDVEISIINNRHKTGRKNKK